MKQRSELAIVERLLSNSYSERYYSTAFDRKLPSIATFSSRSHPFHCWHLQQMKPKRFD